MTLTKYRCIQNFFGYCDTEPQSDKFTLIQPIESIQTPNEKAVATIGAVGTKSFEFGSCANSPTTCPYYHKIESATKPPVDLSKEAEQAGRDIQAIQTAFPEKKPRKKKVAA